VVRRQGEGDDRDHPGGGAGPAGLLAHGRLGTAAPAEQGMDAAIRDDLDAVVPDGYPQVRSVLVVRHGYLVVEREGWRRP
jgi:hypothetical protein